MNGIYVQVGEWLWVKMNKKKKRVVSRNEKVCAVTVAAACWHYVLEFQCPTMMIDYIKF